VKYLGWIVLVWLLGSSLAFAKTYRDPAQRAAFMHQYPCPSTGKTKGRCPGYVVDHVKPLCAGGADRPSNMQWQTREEAKNKDRMEREQCKRR
jgi:hypothetical protein